MPPPLVGTLLGMGTADFGRQVDGRFGCSFEFEELSNFSEDFVGIIRHGCVPIFEMLNSGIPEF
jgi:hypothetical protein